MPFFCFIVYNGHTLCLSNVISPINVSGKLLFFLENASLYKDLTCCIFSCFVLFHIKCVDMSTLPPRRRAHWRPCRQEKPPLADLAAAPPWQGAWTSSGWVGVGGGVASGDTDAAFTAWLFLLLFAWCCWSLSATHREASVRVMVTCQECFRSHQPATGDRRKRRTSTRQTMLVWTTAACLLPSASRREKLIIKYMSSNWSVWKNHWRKRFL